MKKASLVFGLIVLFAAIPAGGQTCAGLDSHFVTLDIPPVMVARETYRLSVSVRNVGTRLWREEPGDETRLGWAGVDAREWNWTRSFGPDPSYLRVS